MNKKLRKLFADPYAYFNDSKFVIKIRKFFNLKINNPFTKIGDNWESNSSLPIAVMLGFMPWKRSFVAEYLREFRTLFVNTIAPLELYSEKFLSYDPACIIIWGYNEHYDVKPFASQHNIPVYRMEDGFLRSTSLGSIHTKPYSVVIDKSSLYYNGEESSDLEKLLRSYDFERHPDLLKNAEQLMYLQRDLGISKYNLPIDNNINLENNFSANKQRILVLGQVDDDKSIEYGCAKNWTSSKLIEVACLENPNAEIIYKPHPDVLAGLRVNKNTRKSLPSQCKIISNILLSDLFKIVNRVYVISSLSGFEALLYGLQVTVFGLPFYAGWGLTDDRFKQHSRNRKLTLTELYAGAYLLYPRYCLNLNDSIDGCKKTILNLCSEKNKIKLAGNNWLNNQIPIALLYGKFDENILKKSDILSNYRILITDNPN